MDWGIILPVGFILLGTAGIACAGLATWYYVRVECGESKGVSVALVLFLLQYTLAYGVAFSFRVRQEALLRTILMFFTAIALVIEVRVGLQSQSKGGIRIALAGVFTLGAYLCLVARFLPRY